MQLRVQSWAKKWSLGCVNFLIGPAWLLLSKTGSLFSPALYFQKKTSKIIGLNLKNSAIQIIVKCSNLISEL